MPVKDHKPLKRLQWIARLRPESCPGGVPTTDAEWRTLVNSIVVEVRKAVAELSDKSDRSDQSDQSDPVRLLCRHGGYRRLRGFQVATINYDATRIFCDRFIPQRSRTHDQMVQAARSGRQNIAEGGFTEQLYRKRTRFRGR